MAIDFEQYLYDRVKPIMEEWYEPGIYAISFFVYSNESNTYRGISNVSEFAIGYNTEEDCGGASAYSEERWNFVFWRQDMRPIIEPHDEDEGMKKLFQWYGESGLSAIGYEDETTKYDESAHILEKARWGTMNCSAPFPALPEGCRRKTFEACGGQTRAHHRS